MGFDGPEVFGCVRQILVTPEICPVQDADKEVESKEQRFELFLKRIDSNHAEIMAALHRMEDRLYSQALERLARLESKNVA
jgi:hypothetical protein